jgi:hypothetical protein
VDSDRTFQWHPQVLARLTGVLFILTFITALPPVTTFYVPALSNPDYVLETGANASLSWGALLELLLIIANIGTALTLYPVLRRHQETLALGYVAARIIECCFIAVGILALLALETVRLEAAGADSGMRVLVAQALVAVHDWTFLLGPGFVVGVGNGLILGYLMYTSRLVPRVLSVLGLVGGPLIIASGIAILFGAFEPGSIWQVVATVPEFFWELSLGIWLMVKGFNPTALSAVLASDHGPARSSSQA